MKAYRFGASIAWAIAGFLIGAGILTGLAQEPVPESSSLAPNMTRPPRPLPSSSKPPLALLDGERILFLGDALMAGEMKSGHIESHLRVRFPGCRILCRNMAWLEDGLLAATGQDRVEYLKKWIAAFRPSLVIIGYGMGGSLTNKTDPDAFQKEVESFVDAVRDSGKAAKPRWALIGPVPREAHGLMDTNATRQNLQLRLYENRLRGVASRRDGVFVQLSDKFVQPALATRGITPLTKDSIHPNFYGYARLAECMEIAFNWQPNTWRIGFTAEGRLRDDNWGVKITDFSVTAAQACWTALHQWTPNPVLMGKARPLVMFTPPCRLLIPNLMPGNYELRIDGVAVSTQSHQAWAGEEIIFKGAPFDQAERLRLAIVERNRAWSQYVSELKPDSKDIAGVEDARIDTLERQIDSLCEPVPHRYEIKPAP
jgi:hypothetical protein